MLEYKETKGGLVEPQRILPVESEYDVVVAGGGIAGVGAAIAAARGGCKTLVIEQTSGLGGLATMGLVNIPLDYLSGIGEEMFRELKAVDGLWHRNSDPEKHKLVLDRMVRGAGGDILLVTSVVNSIVRNGAIRGVVVESKSGRQAILAQRVIDCSGDADAAHFAGCEYVVGRDSDGYTQGCSLDFRLGGVDWDMYQSSECKAKDARWEALIAKGLSAGDLPYPIDNHLNWMTHVPGRPEHCGMDEVSICFAHSRNCKPLSNRDLTRMYLEGREQCDILWKFIRKYVPGFGKSWLVETAPLLGVRDSRRVLGEYVLTGFDVARRAKFDDVIATTWRGFDVHNPTGPGNQKWFETRINGETKYITAGLDGYGSSSFPPGGPNALSDYAGRTGADLQDNQQKTHYDVPYRSLVPLKVNNLLVAGRCLSADFPGQSATRLVMCCNAMGEAAGHAMVLSLKHNIPPRRVDRVELQRRLIEAGCSLGQAEREIPGVTSKLAAKAGCLAFVCLLLFGAVVIAADTHYVATNGVPVPPYTNSWADAATNIQDAVYASSAGDTVLVSNGVYITATPVITNWGVAYTNVSCVYLDRKITLKSVNGPNVTVIDGNYNMITARCVLVSAGATVDGFTIRNGHTRDDAAFGDLYGGGILIFNGITVGRPPGGIVTNCIVHNNYGRLGGGIVIRYGTGIVENCTIYSNTSRSSGGGFYIDNAPPGSKLKNCSIFDNKVTNSCGGGIICTKDSNLTVRNCLIYRNTASLIGGGGVYVTTNSPTCIINFDNCTIVSNYAAGNGGGLFLSNSPSANVCNSIIYYNASPSDADVFTTQTALTNNCMSNTNALTSGLGNITNAPLFVNTNSANYRLSANSPCRNTGINREWMDGAVDLDGHSRIDRFSRIADMGAYEFINSGTIFSSR